MWKKDGPLNVIKIDPEKFENKRKNFSKNYYLNKENHIKDIDIKIYKLHRKSRYKYFF